jgi:hypothetical protein
MAAGPVGTSEFHHGTWWPGVALGVGVSCACAYQQFKLPPILPDLLREHPHDPAVAAGFMSIYALIGLMVSQLLGRWLQGEGRLSRGLGSRMFGIASERAFRRICFGLIAAAAIISLPMLDPLLR